MFYKTVSKIALCLLVTIVNLTSVAAFDEEAMRLRMKDGSSLSVGKIVPISRPNAVGWLSDGFEQPFEFDLRSIRSISTMASNDFVAPADGQCFELSDGGLICGQLKSIDDQWVEIDSKILGLMRAERARVVSMIDGGYAGTMVYSGPRDDKNWKPGQKIGDTENWEFEAGTLVAKRQGASISGAVQLPKKSQIHFVLSWKGAPDFVFSFGTDSTLSATASTVAPAAARLEVWDKQLALLREVDTSADIELLAELVPTNPRLELTVYIDQDAGLVIVCDAHGKPLDRMSLPAKTPRYENAVQLVNHGASLTLERFEVREWDGVTTVGGTGSGIVLNDGSDPIPGQIVGFDAASGEVLITTEGENRRIPLSTIRRGDFNNAGADVSSDASAQPLPPAVEQPPQLTANTSDNAADQRADDVAAGAALGGDDAAEPKNDVAGGGEETATTRAIEPSSLTSVAGMFEAGSDPEPTPTEPPAEPVKIELVWMDRTRLTGNWLPAEASQLKFAAIGLEQPVSFSPAALRGMLGTVDRFGVDLTKQKNGTLKIGETQLAGFLEETTPSNANSSLAWHPHGSLTAAGISSNASGAIIYRAPLPKKRPGTENAAQPTDDAIARPVVQLFLGGNRASSTNKAKDAPKTTASNSDERELVFRSGDAIKGVITRVDESGILFESTETTTTFATHDQFQSVWLNRKRREYELAPEKLSRLMTVPRAMKFDPPTHLFVSIMGDYLRGRLISVDEETISAEIRSEVKTLPREQIAQIIWLHDRDWNNKTKDSEKASDEPPKPVDGAADTTVATTSPASTVNGEVTQPIENDIRFRVHTIKANDRGLTFVPETVAAGVLRGTSDLLGQCSVEVNELNQVLFGRDIDQQVRAYREDPWTLSLAQSPIVFSEEGGASAQAGANSPLVGQAAPDFGLKDLAGNSFRIEESHDRVVVLDFWASWCGPCVQTMPLVEEAVKEIGEDKVHLVAINIQEAPERVQAAVERLGLAATVLLDRDGEVAAAYGANAIPQTVIINKEGIVTHVFVGGGAKIVEAIRAALEEKS